jgi:dipeptidyl aminopeptidase/acylaminoacyl peptidase
MKSIQISLQACLALTLMLLALHVDAAQPAGMKPVDLLSTATLSNPRLSPDGKSVVYVKREPNWDKNKSLSNLWLSDTSTGKVRQLTYSDKPKQSPAWSPDGRFVSFLSDAKFDGDKDEDYKAIHLLPMSGGEAAPVGEHWSDIVSYEWNPSADTIYFLADRPLDEDQRKRKSAKDDMHPFDEPHSERHLWRVSIADGTVERLTEDGRYIRSFDLSDDGSLLAFSSASGARIDDKHTADIWLMDTVSKSINRVTNNGHAETNIQLSPDNKSMLFVADVNDEFEFYYDANLFVVSTTGEPPVLIAGDQVFEIEDAQWARDSKSIYVKANMGVRSEIWALSAAGNDAIQITDAEHTVKDWSFSVSTGQHVFVSVTPENPGEICLASFDGERQRMLTTEFADFGDRYLLPKQDLVTWQGADGADVEGLISYPLGYSSDKRYPLIVNIHGGPRSSIQFGQFSWRSYIPVAAAEGFVVFSPNYRGGRGYGDDFLRDMVGGYFNNAHLDVMSGIDHLVAEGIVDPDQIVAAGWSAGGHMVNKLITYTDRFKATSSGAGAVDWVSMYGESDTRYSRTAWFGGKPWEANAPIATFNENSPLKDMWKAKTPTLIFVGEKDTRVPPTQSIMLYRALEDLGVDTKLYIAPREGHGFTELRHRLFKINVELDWFYRYLNRPDYVWQSAPD